MARELKHPNNEEELKATLDLMYRITKDENESDEGRISGFKNLIEIVGSEANIVTSIHKLKANPGSKTPGVDDITIRDFLEAHYDDVIEFVRNSLHNYHPKPVRRKWIPKPGKEEKRPLGIPTIGDRIVQECVRNVIEPILEAQFFKHSYGFRPMRDPHQALQRLNNTIWRTGCIWAIEGDISKFFDKVNHSILLKKLWGMGIRDRRILMIIKQMLKAGIMDECKKNDLGTPQGGIISPLLANVYLHSFDKWVTREWEGKKLKHKYAGNARHTALRHQTNLKPTYLVRYADDWVLLTNSKTNAEKWKHRIEKYLKNNLKLDLSPDKTLITNVSKRAIKFLGHEIKVRPGKANRKAKGKWVTQSRPNHERLKTKVEEIRKLIKDFRRQPTKEQLIVKINHVNSKIRGLAEFYKTATLVNVDLGKYRWSLNNTAKRSLAGSRTGRKASLMPANQTDNLLSVHEKYKTKIWTVEHEGKKFGLTDIYFVKWQQGPLKNQDETPYTAKGRKINLKRSKKVPLKVRADELLNEITLRYALLGKAYHPRYNFEFNMNKAYVYNRDKGKCRVCREEVDSLTVNIHHNCPELHLKYVNRVVHLSTVCIPCHQKIHDGNDYSHLGKKFWDQIQKFRDMLPIKTENELAQLRECKKTQNQ